MATKNLARTVIEGGRCGYFKSECNEKIRSERAQTRIYLRAVTSDPEYEESSVAPKRKTVSVCFKDKLRPIYRFLDSQIGRDWNTVRSELFTKFDTRTTPGRHVLFDHLLRDVRESLEPLDQPYASYFIDAEGRLCKEKDRYATYRRTKYVKYDLNKVVAWLGCRKVGRLGSGFAWFVPTRDMRFIRAFNNGNAFYGEIIYVYADETGKPLQDAMHARLYPHAPSRPWIAHNLSFRQYSALSAKDEAFFRALPTHVQDKLLKMAPANV